MGCVIGGFFQELYHSRRTQRLESSFEYEITNGTFNFQSGGIEFTKWYFPFSYQYKIWGQIVYKQTEIEENENKNDDIGDDEIWFKGEWQRCGTRRSGELNMKLSNKTVVLEHTIKPGPCIFFGLSSMSKEEDDERNVYMKIDAQLLEHGMVDGFIYLFDEQWMNHYDNDEDDVAMPDNAYAYEKHAIIDGEWHHFGNIAFVFDNDKETNGFFNGSYYIGEWHPYTQQYSTKKYQNGGKLKRSTSVLLSFSTDDAMNDSEDDDDEQNDNDL